MLSPVASISRDRVIKRRVLKLAGIISKQFYATQKGNESRLHGDICINTSVGKRNVNIKFSITVYKSQLLAARVSSGDRTKLKREIKYKTLYRQEHLIVRELSLTTYSTVMGFYF